MNYSTNKKVSGASGSFDHPEKIPENAAERDKWQEENRNFWEKHSMRYDWKKEIGFTEFSSEFYQEIDRRFLAAVHEVMPWKKVPFEQWIDYETLRDKDVLEIGVGNGTHAQLIAPNAKSYHGIDLTAYAQHSTSTRLDIFHLPGTILLMDAENLQFRDQSFDLVWSWGVIHHSSNTEAILQEIHRVLRPQGMATIMVYYRSLWSYYLAGILIGIFKGHFFKGKTIHQINQSRTDGALARYYTFRSWRKQVESDFKILRLETLGNKGDLLPIPGGSAKRFVQRFIPNWLTVFLLRNLRMGSFLICQMERK